MNKPHSLNYLRVYSDENGDSCFSDEVISFSEKTPAVFLSKMFETKGLGFLRFSGGSFQDLHTAPRRQFILQLTGELEIKVTNGETRCLRAGDVALAEDTTGKGHTTRIISQDDVIIAVSPCIET